LQKHFVFSLALVALQDFLGAHLRLLDVVEVAVHVRKLTGAGVAHSGPHRHDPLDQVEILSGSMVLVGEVFGVVDELGRP